MRWGKLRRLTPLGSPLPLTIKLCYAGNRSDDFAERFKHPATRRSIEADLKLIDALEEQTDDIERAVDGGTAADRADAGIDVGQVSNVPTP